MALYSDWLKGSASDSSVPLGGTGRPKPRGNGGAQSPPGSRASVCATRCICYEATGKERTYGLSGHLPTGNSSSSCECCGCPTVVHLVGHIRFIVTDRSGICCFPILEKRSISWNSFEQQAQGSGSSSRPLALGTELLYL